MNGVKIKKIKNCDQTIRVQISVEPSDHSFLFPVIEIIFQEKTLQI